MDAPNPIAHTRRTALRAPPHEKPHRAENGACSVFLATFILARIVVLLIMTHRIPSLYLHHGGTHVHHLNYGIFLLSIVGAVAIFLRPEGRALTATALAYGIGVALTFDEFGMWLHLGGPYWQRASFDVMVLIAAVLGLYCAAPAWERIRPKHWVATAGTDRRALRLRLRAESLAQAKHAERQTLSVFFNRLR